MRTKRSGITSGAYAAMEAEEFGAIAKNLFQASVVRPGASTGMPEAMDAASGISATRRIQFETETKRALIGRMLNFPYPFLFKAYGDLDLGDGFRQAVHTKTPGLFLNGTLDGRTFPEETWQILRGFDHGFHIIVENAGHDLFMSSPAVGAAIVRFFKDGSIKKSTIHIPPPKFQ